MTAGSIKAVLFLKLGPVTECRYYKSCDGSQKRNSQRSVAVTNSAVRGPPKAQSAYKSSNNFKTFAKQTETNSRKGRANFPSLSVRQTPQTSSLPMLLWRVHSRGIMLAILKNTCQEQADMATNPSAPQSEQRCLIC